MALSSASSVNATSASGCTALYLSAEEGDEQTVRLLLERAANVDLAATDGSTPLMQASHFGHVQVAFAC